MKNDSKWIGLLLDSNGFIVVNKILVKKLGLDESVLLGELISEYNYYEKINGFTDKVWFYSTTPNIEEQTGLYRKTIEKSINKLKKEGLIDVRINGMPRKRYIKINFKEVEKFIKKSIKILPSKDNNTNKQGQKDTQVGTKGHTSKDNNTNKQGQKDTQVGTKGHTSKDNNTNKQGQKDTQVGTKDTINNNNNSNNNKNKKKNNITNLILSRKDEMDERKKDDLYKNFKNNIKYNTLLEEYREKPSSKDNLQNILNIIQDLYKLKENEYIKISGKKVYANEIIETLNKYNIDTIEYVLESISKNASNIKNIKAYTIAILYNAPKTINIYYQGKINNDFRKMAENKKDKEKMEEIDFMAFA